MPKPALTLDDLVQPCHTCAALAAWGDRYEQLGRDLDTACAASARSGVTDSPAVRAAIVALTAHETTRPDLDTVCATCGGMGRVPTNLGATILAFVALFLPAVEPPRTLAPVLPLPTSS